MICSFSSAEYSWNSRRSLSFYEQKGCHRHGARRHASISQLFLGQFFILLKFGHFHFRHAVDIVLRLNDDPLFDHAAILQLTNEEMKKEVKEEMNDLTLD